MAEDEKAAKRTVMAPSSTSPMSVGEVLSVEVGANEDVEWVWSHDRERGSSVTGFRIIPRIAEHRSPA
jgi:hypothetical protein